MSWTMDKEGRSLFLILIWPTHNNKKKLEAYLVGLQAVRCSCRPRKVRPSWTPEQSITIAFMVQRQHPVNLY